MAKKFNQCGRLHLGKIDIRIGQPSGVAVPFCSHCQRSVTDAEAAAMSRGMERVRAICADALQWNKPWPRVMK